MRQTNKFRLKFERRPEQEQQRPVNRLERRIYALFSDIHANLEAAEAVVKDMMREGVTDRVCLGDIVGYGADSSACVDFIQGLGCPTLLGNHDAEAAEERIFNTLNEGAKAGIFLARKQLDRAQKSYLLNRPYALRNDHFEATHASLHSPSAWRYIIDDNEAEKHFQEQTMTVCFFGHTHYPCIWEREENGNIELYAGMSQFVLKEGCRYLVNTGSVGQPRDRNNKACYVIYDHEAKRVIWRRVEYDITRVQEKIIDAGLPDNNARRLSNGR
ncbi:MAG: metallophosphoesterase family protein [Verrucomicrobiota bacterium]